jgi:hypothetical protein
MHRIDCHGLQLAKTVVSSCGDSLFNVIFYLVATEFDVQSLQLCTVQSFCNAIIGGNQHDFNCLHQHLSPYLLENVLAIASWQEYLVNMVLPYEKGNVEGCRFYLQWLSIIFRVNIQVWSALPDGTIHSWSIDLNYDRTIDILSLKIDMTHIHYQPLLGNIIGLGFNVHATQTASNLHTCGTFFNENETPPSCDKAIQGLNKKCRLIYHNLKKIMREIRPSCDEATQGLNKKCRLSYRNLKKFLRKREKNIGGIGTTDALVSNVNASQTTLNVNKRRMLFNHSEIHPNYHKVIFPLNKKHTLSYCSLKKVMRERKKFIAMLPFREKLTYHNLKKFVRAQHNIDRYCRISHNGHATVPEEKITFRGLEATSCSASNENQ